MWTRAIPVGLVVILGLGCGSTPVVDTASSPVARNLQAIGTAYMQTTQRLNRPPKDLKELQIDLKMQGKVDELLRSSDDNQPFVLVWNVELRRLTARGSDIPIVAYEKTGKDGQRHVLRGQSEVLLLSESQLQGAKLPPDHKLPF